MQTEDAVSANVTAGQVLFSLIAFSTFYIILFAVMVTLFVREIKKGPHHEEEMIEENHDPFMKEGQHAIS
jgi:cytochrome d ubiquinol oxidase subunit I